MNITDQDPSSDPQVVEQLRCAGVIEAIRISRAAYPNRMPHLSFVRRFRMLDKPSTPTPRAAEEVGRIHVA
jgi:myosin V